MVTMSTHFPRTRRIRQIDNGRPDRRPRGQLFLEQGGYIRLGHAAGVYTLMPLGWRVHQRVCNVIFGAMSRAGVQNMQLPILQPRELWERSGRWASYATTKTMFQTAEPHRGTQFGLAPTAEEIVTATVAADVRSWRELPLRLHQIGPKFRAELRPRHGLLRAREFYMSDGYSFDRDEAGMRETFELFRNIYGDVYDELGFDNVIAVQADSGAIGGSGSAEFMALSDAGEDVLLTCERCDYGANAEKADSRFQPSGRGAALRAYARVHTPGVTSIDGLAAFVPDVTPRSVIKTVLFSDSDDGELVAVYVRGDLDVNETKLANLTGRRLEPATPEAIEAATGARAGFAGPIGIRGIDVALYDRSVDGMENFACGLNETDWHAVNVNFGRDLSPPRELSDLHLAVGGHGCPECSAGTLAERRGIELGHIFMLQTTYAEKLGATYVDEQGNENPMWMGCYGIGTTRIVQAMAECAHDEDGLRWPAPMAPYDVSLVVTRPSEGVAESLADDAAARLQAAGLSVLCDKRPGSVGTKFKDADLIGCPLRVTVGRGAANGLVEVRSRATGDSVDVRLDELVPAATGMRSAQRSRSRTNGRMPPAR